MILKFLKRLWLFVLRLWDQNLFSHIQNQLVESRDIWYLFLYIYLFFQSVKLLDLWEIEHVTLACRTTRTLSAISARLIKAPQSPMLATNYLLLPLWWKKQTLPVQFAIQRRQQHEDYHQSKLGCRAWTGQCQYKFRRIVFNRFCYHASL